MNYYYLIASLPTINMDSPPPFSFEDFRSLCKEHVSPSDLTAIDDLLDPLSGESGNEFVNRWRDTEIQLRNSMAKLRAATWKKDPTPYLKEHKHFDTEIDRIVSETFSTSNPAEREFSIDKFRWAKAEEFAGHDPFSARALLAYVLKLLIAQRWAAMNDETGGKIADDIINREPDDEKNTGKKGNNNT